MVNEYVLTSAVHSKAESLVIFEALNGSGFLDTHYYLHLYYTRYGTGKLDVSSYW